MEKLEKAKNLLEIQGRDGNWNHDEYMRGMYNGMELIIATLEGRESKFRRPICVNCRRLKGNLQIKDNEFICEDCAQHMNDIAP